MQAKLALVALLLTSVSGAKILALMAVPSRSHHIWNSRYLEALARRGHEITYFSPDQFASPPKNMRQILIEGAYDIYESIDLSEVVSLGPYSNTRTLYQWLEETSAKVKQSKGFRELMQVMRREKFDLVVHDFTECWFLLGGVDLLGRPPVVALTAFGIPSSALSVLGNPLSYSSKPYFLSYYSNIMTLPQRVDNYILHLWTFVLEWLFLRKEDENARSSFGPNIRPLGHILEDINIILVNSNYATDFPFPRVPGLIPVGGLHIEKPKPLPQELKTFLDEANNGVIYFSLGSNIKASMVSTKYVHVLCEAFGQISPVRVLWKWDSGSVPNQPPNVKIVKWAPQNDVLAHPNLRLFFTHSGLLSTQEAIYHAKPMVALPFFADQHVNSNRCVQRGLGEKLTLDSLTAENVLATIRKVLTDPRYAENARNASSLFKDDLESPLERAVFWTEYAMRHKGAPHLRHTSRNLSWYQNWMLDAIMVTGCVGCLASWGVWKLVVAVVVRKRRKPGAGSKKVK